MGLLCITYYTDVMRHPMQDVKIHHSAKAATDYLMKHAQDYFTSPIQSGSKNPVISKKSQLSVGVGFRKMVGRVLDEEEVRIYKEYGDDAWCDFETKRLIAPPKGEIE